MDGLFVYADEAAKLKRCLERADEKENMNEKEILRMMRKIDKERAEYRAFYTDIKWGRKENYHLCVNTSGVEIKDLIVQLCTYIRVWHQAKANNCSDNQPDGFPLFLKNMKSWNRGGKMSGSDPMLRRKENVKKKCDIDLKNSDVE